VLHEPPQNSSIIHGPSISVSDRRGLRRRLAGLGWLSPPGLGSPHTTPLGPHRLTLVPPWSHNTRTRDPSLDGWTTLGPASKSHPTQPPTTLTLLPDQFVLCSCHVWHDNEPEGTRRWQDSINRSGIRLPRGRYCH
jgi:hypothetical protein